MRFLLMTKFTFWVDGFMIVVVVAVYQWLLYHDALFYLNVSIPFTINISSIPWTELSSLPGLTSRTGASACIDANGNRSIVQIGGTITQGSPFITTFDTTKQQWIFTMNESYTSKFKYAP
ncbi:3681_t:CDS:1 [Gigaspora rosea]|nr:3681_t:CDS:1 [Gigaspora rosea]